MDKPWPTCVVKSCIGIRLNEHDRCLVHSEPAVQDRYFDGIAPNSEVDLRGTELSASLIDRLLDAARSDGQRAVLGDADFAEATMETVSFRRVEFTGHAMFDFANLNDALFEDVRFAGDAAFNQADFARDSMLVNVEFGGIATFQEALFRNGVTFDEGTTFMGKAWFEKAGFHGYSYFGGATFRGTAQFAGAKFADLVSFRGANFGGAARFHGARFGGVVEFGGVSSAGEVDFQGAEFERVDLLGPISARKLILESAVFRRNLIVETDAVEVDCTRAVFEEGVSLRVSRARVKFDQVIPRKTSAIVSGATAAVISLRETDVVDLMLTDISLSDCRFAGAHHLDKLRLEGICTFGSYRRRQVLAEELAWRADRNVPVGPRRVADLYRQLRKAQEDSKNEPGAADFYYGEMEMRRHSRATPWSERVILHLYWLVSGYGLRALATLAVLIAVVSTSMWLGGFKTTPAFGDTLIYVAQSTVSLETKLASLPKDLTPLGEVLRLVTRVLGPLLLGLTLLAVRNRVKR
ncbi:pentapeptide repeat-containing protein [Amycolatopsis sp. cmx-4-54]|uniref:pentapeptide repeat-containing protein n=1 Tax=Amycolatopsis sp. cmx-4-54 TaxID=2790936 RepID=UPI00397B3983